MVLQTLWKWLSHTLRWEQDGDRPSNLAALPASPRTEPATPVSNLEKTLPDLPEPIAETLHPVNTIPEMRSPDTAAAPTSEPGQEISSVAGIERSPWPSAPEPAVQVSASPFPQPSDRPHPQIATVIQVPQAVSTAVGSTLFQQYQDQQSLIHSLQQQIESLQPSARIGETMLNRCEANLATHSSGFSPGFSPVGYGSQPQDHPSGAISQEQLEAQEKTIAQLRQQLRDIQRLAAIGESRLNRWRNRTFSS